MGTMIKYLMIFIFGALAVHSFNSCQHPSPVDLIVYNASVYTVDSAFTITEAFAINEGKFIETGTTEYIRSKYTGKKELDAQGMPIYPGFYDPHAHFFGYALTLGQADLVGSRSFEEVIDRLRTFRDEFPNADWIIGRGWDQNLWPSKVFPDRFELDKAFPDIPVYIVRVDGHAALANQVALERAGIDRPIAIAGGDVQHVNGRLTGILVDNAMERIRTVIPHHSLTEMEQMLRKAEQNCLALGLTTVSDAGLERVQIDFLDSLYQEKALLIRNHAMINISDENLDYYLAKGPYVSDKFTVHTFKILADGALGSRGACMLQPYSDAPTSGFLLFSPETIEQAVNRIATSDFQVSTHAIGDSTNRLILDIYGKHLKGKNDRRWRIEHAQIIHPDDMHKFGRYSIIPSIQPTHATSDMFWAIDRIGPSRLKGAYAFKELLNQVGVLPSGSDFPVEQINPLFGFHAAVARVDTEDLPVGGFQMENALTREEALRGMTIWSAYAGFEEQIRGSIEAGKIADFVMLEEDIMQVDVARLRQVSTLQTVIGGETVYLSANQN